MTSKVPKRPCKLGFFSTRSQQTPQKRVSRERLLKCKANRANMVQYLKQLRLYLSKITTNTPKSKSSKSLSRYSLMKIT